MIGLINIFPLTNELLTRIAASFCISKSKSTTHAQVPFVSLVYGNDELKLQRVFLFTGLDYWAQNLPTKSTVATTKSNRQSSSKQCPYCTVQPVYSGHPSAPNQLHGVHCGGSLSMLWKFNDVEWWLNICSKRFCWC